MNKKYIPVILTIAAIIIATFFWEKITLAYDIQNQIHGDYSINRYNANNDEEGMGGAVQPKPYDKIIDSLDIVDLLISPLNSNSPQTPLVIVWSAMKEKMINDYRDCFL